LWEGKKPNKTVIADCELHRALLATLFMKHTLAHSVSILGHPALVVPLVVTLLSWHSSVVLLWKTVIFMFILAAILVVFSFWQVHRHQWQDIDASRPPERKTLNLVLAVGLCGAGVVTSVRSFPAGLALGLFVSSLQVITAILVSQWLKLSLHSTFDAFCSILLWPFGLGAVFIGLTGTAVVAWSRLVLARHTVSEVLGGTGMGIVGGVLYWLLRRGGVS
jgi:membrane-associated phospholipid phosphatase